MTFQIVGCALLLVGAVIACREYDRLRGKAVSEGRVVRLEPDYISTETSGPTCTLVAEFKDNAGITRQYRSGFSSGQTGYREGDPIRIYFDRNAPDKCGVVSFGYRFGLAWCLAIAGTAMILGSFGWHIGDKWLKTKFPTTTEAQQNTR